MIRSWWLKSSIRYKIFLFAGTILVFSALLALFSSLTLSRYLSEFDYVLVDSYRVNETLEAFEAERAAFIQFANYRQPEQQEAYEQAQSNTMRSMDALRFDYQKMGVDRYLLTQSARAMYRTYQEYCARTLSYASSSESGFVNAYYSAGKVATFIKTNILNLMIETMAEGNSLYYQKLNAYQAYPAVVIFLLLVGALLAVALWKLTNRYLLRPVLSLADSARSVADNQFDSPDVVVENEDEIGELTFAFNTMRRTMSSFIASLQEKRDMEARLHEEEIQRVSTEASLQKLQISLLQSQINPHFLFNTLNTISNMAKFENAPDTKELILRLSNLFRYNLQTSDETVTLTRELQIIKDYMYIQYRRFGKRLQLEVECDIDSDRVFIPTFTLQPIVENAVIHGLSPKEDDGMISIRICEEKGMAHILVADNGVGMTQQRMQELMNVRSNKRGHVSGIGVGNVRDRVQLLCPGSEFSIHSQVGEGTQVSLKIPLPAECAPQKGEKEN